MINLIIGLDISKITYSFTLANIKSLTCTCMMCSDFFKKNNYLTLDRQPSEQHGSRNIKDKETH